MPAQPSTFEEIDRHVAKLDLAAFRSGGRQHFTLALAQSDPRGTQEKICSIYRGVRPILSAIAAIPLIPPRWREALRVFISLMDGLCPEG